MSKRAVAYIRVSKEREGMTSPELQLTSIEEHCRKMGYSVVETLEDLDLSGRFWKRRQVDRAVRMIENREADVLVVWKISRVARNMKDWVIAVDRVEGAGGHIESATEQFDNTVTGGLARGVMAQFADFESKRIGETWKETHARRVRNGMPHHGLPRFGYNYSKETGYVPDEVVAPVLRQMYLLYTQGVSLRDIGAYAASEGVSPPNGWRDQGVRHILDRGFGAGYIWSKGELVTGAHEAVISEHEWMAYKVQRDKRAARSSGGGTKGGAYAYSSLLRCPCGSKMDGGAVKRSSGESYRRYTCRDGLVKGTHSKVSVSESYVEEAVLAWMNSIAEEVNTRGASVKPARRENTGRKLQQLNTDLKRNATRIDSLTRKYIDEDIPTDAYRRLLADLEAEKAALEARIRLVEVNSTAKPTEIVPDLLAQWPNLPERGKRATLEKLIANIQLHDWENGARVGRRRLEIIEHQWD
jgi:DNA invertase Pin-like site-specific DNA recombinase